MISIIEGLNIKVYIQCMLIENDILTRIKTPFEPNKLNALNYYFHELYYQINEDFIFISKIKPELSTISFNHCIQNKKISQICNSKEKNIKKHTYKIIITFKYPKSIKNVKKISVPLIILELNCSNKNSNQLDTLTYQIEKIVKKDIYLKNIYQTIILEKN